MTRTREAAVNQSTPDAKLLGNGGWIKNGVFFPLSY